MMMYEVVEEMNRLYDKKQRYQTICALVYGGGIVGLALSVTVMPFLLGFSVLFLILGGGICACYVGPMIKTMTREIRTMYKDNFLKGMFDEFFEEACYEGWWGFSEIEVMETGLYKLGNEFESEDKLSGIYKGVRFKQSDVHTWKRVERDEGVEEIDYFDGRMFVFDTTLQDIHSVRVYSRTGIGSENDRRIRPEEHETVSTESVQFNEWFSVYAQAAHDAFYVLTPDRMERIMRIFKQYCKKSNGDYYNMSLHFRSGKLYCAMEVSGNAFDPGDFPINYPEEKAKMKEDIQVIIDVIESLNLIDKDALDGKEEAEETEIMDDVIVTGERKVKQNGHFTLKGV